MSVSVVVVGSCLSGVGYLGIYYQYLLSLTSVVGAQL
jgi:hypothetical protein